MPMVPPRRQAEPVGSLISLSLLTRLDGDALASVLCTHRGCCRNVAPRAYGRRCSQLHTAGPTLWRTGPATPDRAHVLPIPALRCASILTGALVWRLPHRTAVHEGVVAPQDWHYHRAVSQRPRAAFGSSCLLGGRPPRSVRGTGDGGRKECRRRHSGPGRRTPGITANVRLRLRAVCPSSSIVTLCGRHCTWDRSQHVRRVGWDVELQNCITARPDRLGVAPTVRQRILERNGVHPATISGSEPRKHRAAWALIRI